MSISQRPNVVVMISHDTGRFVSPYGYETLTTPNYERLGAESTRFENAFTTAPQCSPSRASLFTGRYPHNNGVMGLCQPNWEWEMNHDERSIAHYFGDGGYATWLIGISHEDLTPVRRGFEVKRTDHGAKRIGNASRFLGELLDDHDDDERPFMCQIGCFETHRDWTRNAEPDDSKGVTIPPYLNDGPRTRQEMAEMQGASRKLDEGLGGVLDLLEERGLVDNTILVVTTDHGIAMPRAKCSLYDPGIENLLFMRWPAGGWPVGDTRDAMISNIDILPTLLEACDLPIADCIQGRSFLPLLAGGDYTRRDAIFCEKTFHCMYDPMRGLRTERFKYILDFEKTTGLEVAGDIYHRGAHIELERRYSHRPGECLYDLEADPNEFENLAEKPEYSETVAEMRRRLGEWMRETDDPLLKGPPPSPTWRAAIAKISAE